MQKSSNGSEKFTQLVEKLLIRKDEDRLKDFLQDYDEFEQGIIFGVRLELLKAEREFRKSRINVRSEPSWKFT